MYSTLRGLKIPDVPQLMAHWDSTTNFELDPSSISVTSKKEVSWKCEVSYDHCWVTSPSNRWKNKDGFKIPTGCPFCNGRKVSSTNSLHSVMPHIAETWDYGKNGDLTPRDVTWSSGIKVWWKCPEGLDHEWKTSINGRTANNGKKGCPYCLNQKTSMTNNLAKCEPTISSEWHPTKNGKLSPHDVVAKSKRKVWWKCPEGPDHEWEATPGTRVRGSGCPYCANKFVCSTNNLESVDPELAKLWHPTKNGDLLPSSIVAGTHKKVWWKCPEGPDHEWRAEPAIIRSNRLKHNGSGCPYCSGKIVSVTNNLESVDPESSRLWHPTKNGDLLPSSIVAGTHKTVWWKCPEGPDHEWEAPVFAIVITRKKGNTGCPYCRSLRVSKTNSLSLFAPDVAKQWHPTKNGDLLPSSIVAGSGKKVWWKCPEGPDHEWKTSVVGRTTRGDGCPFCANQKLSSTNSLKSKFPEIASLWHPTKNGGKLPTDVIAGSNKRYWWKCPEGPDHEWKATSGSMVTSFKSGNSGCNYCRGVAVSITNSLESLFPHIAKEWHPTKNGEVMPSDVVAGSRKKYWWKCPEGPDHEWEANISNRVVNESGCPCCSGHQVSVTNSLRTVYPKLALLFHPTKNEDITPDNITWGSGKKVWWLCNKGHEWETTANSLVWNARNGGREPHLSGCPECRLFPRSDLEIRVAFELAQFYNIDQGHHKIRVGSLLDVDIIIEELSLIIEYDGHYWHQSKFQKDLEKSKLLQKHGWNVIRVREEPLDLTSDWDCSIDKGPKVKQIVDLIISKIISKGLDDEKRFKSYLKRKDSSNSAAANLYISTMLQ